MKNPAGVPRMVGVYNVIWASTAAAAYFTGGAMLEKLGPKSLFYIPAAIQLTQLGLTLWLESQAQARAARPDWCPPSSGAGSRTAGPANSRPKMFLRLAWLANPFAYIAINTFIAVMPGVARRLELSTMMAGFCCSLWCFARLGAFFVLWRWNGLALSVSLAAHRPTSRWWAPLPPC